MVHARWNCLNKQRRYYVRMIFQAVYLMASFTVKHQQHESESGKGVVKHQHQMENAIPRLGN
jgi:hypothetical protein